MCEYHLHGQCFHPKRVPKGMIAVPCEANGCNDCTNRKWQKDKVSDDVAYYDAIAKIANKAIKLEESQAPKRSFITNMFSKREQTKIKEF